MEKSLPQWFSYIENLHTSTIVLGLERILPVAQKLQLLSFPCPVITVGGTNGKGSCVAFLEQILTAAGYTVATYTSPHLLRFNERIRIANKEIDDLSIINAFEEVEKVRSGITLTSFEFITLAALILFKAAKPDVLLLEIGLGGRLDAVNLVEADISIITSIALDHMDFLGDTREAIAYEKAGIFRSGKPAICGDPDLPANIVEVAKTLKAPLYAVDRDFSFGLASDGLSWFWACPLPNLPPLAREGTKKEISYSNLPIPNLPLQNAAIALMAIQCLQSRLKVNVTAITEGLKKAFLPGRFQRFKTPVEVILDVAHNPASATYLAKRLSEEPTQGITRAVVSILSDKDVIETLRPLLALVQIWYVADLELPRGSTAENMGNCLQQLGVTAYDIHQSKSVAEAFQKAMQASQIQDRILVFGSFHTVAAVLEGFPSPPVGEGARMGG